MYCPSIALKFFCLRSHATDWGGMWWMPLHVTDISAPIDYCNTSDTAWHKCVSMTAHLSCHSSLFFSFPQYAKDLWTNRLKISSNHSLVRRETRLSEWSRRRRAECFSGRFCNFDRAEGQPESKDLPRYIKHTHLVLTKMSLQAYLAHAAPCGIKHTATASLSVVSTGLCNHSSSSPHQNRRCMQRTSDGSHQCLDLSVQNHLETFVHTHQLKINRHSLLIIWKGSVRVILLSVISIWYLMHCLLWCLGFWDISNKSSNNQNN